MAHHPYSQPRPDRAELALRATAFALWPWRLEITIFTILAGAGTYVYLWLHDPVAAGVIVGGVALAVILALHKWLFLAFHKADVRRRWQEAVIRSGAADPPPGYSRRPHSYAGPRVKSVRKTPLGDIVEVSGGDTGGIAELAKHRDRIAELLHVREVRVDVSRDDRGRAKVHIVRRDPLWTPVEPRDLDAEVKSVWEGTYLGVDEEGCDVFLQLVFSNLLVAGEPGGGKSVSLRPFLADAARDPHCDLWLMDGKQIELSTWQPVARGFAGPSGQDAIRVLKGLQAEMSRRYEHLLAEDLDKIPNKPEFRPQILVCDEVAWYLNLQDGSESKIIADLLVDLIQRGRAAGIVLILATQKPAAETIPTAIRDLISYRLVFRCNGSTASNMALGGNWAAEGYNAAEIPKEQPGVGYLRAEGDRPVKIRVPNITRTQAKELVSRVVAKSFDAGLKEFQATFDNQEAPADPLPPAPPNPVGPAPTSNADHRERLLKCLANGEEWTRQELKRATGIEVLAFLPTLEKELVAEKLVARRTRHGGTAKKGNPYLYRLVEVS